MQPTIYNLLKNGVVVFTGTFPECQKLFMSKNSFDYAIVPKTVLKACS
jgi:hypothetical protein